MCLSEWITIEGVVPSKSNSYRIAGNRLYKTKEVRDYEYAFQIQAGPYRNLGIKGDFEIHLHVYYPNNRSDLDNSLKVVLDCLQAIGAIKNDRNCKRIYATKHIDKNNPRIVFKLIA